MHYVFDAETPLDQLILTIEDQTAPGIVNCVIDDQSTDPVNPGVFIDCTTIIVSMTVNKTSNKTFIIKWIF